MRTLARLLELPRARLTASIETSSPEPPVIRTSPAMLEMLNRPSRAILIRREKRSICSGPLRPW
jgi:hypothetical protein